MLNFSSPNLHFSGPDVAVGIYKQLVVVMGQQLNVVCREGHDRGQCRAPRGKYIWEPKCVDFCERL